MLILVENNWLKPVLISYLLFKTVKYPLISSDNKCLGLIDFEYWSVPEKEKVFSVISNNFYRIFFLKNFYIYLKCSWKNRRFYK